GAYSKMPLYNTSWRHIPRGDFPLDKRIPKPSLVPTNRTILDSNRRCPQLLHEVARLDTEVAKVHSNHRHPNARSILRALRDKQSCVMLRPPDVLRCENSGWMDHLALNLPPNPHRYR